MLFSYGYGWQRNRQLRNMQANQWQCWSPCCRGDTAGCASPDGVDLWLHAKPLDAAIRQVPVSNCPGSCHGQGFRMKPKNSNKTQLWPSFLMVDWRKKKLNNFGTQNGPSTHVINATSCINTKPHYLSWKAQLHFELSNIVNGQKFKKLLTLNEAQKPCGPYMAL